MRKQIENLKEFNESFNVEYPKKPQLVSLSSASFRIKLLEEEIQEYREANEDGNLVEVLDAIADILYITIGTALQHGMHGVLDEAFHAVHVSNMSKLGEDGKPIINGGTVYDSRKPLGKILKSDRYTPPTIALEKLLEDEK